MNLKLLFILFSVVSFFTLVSGFEVSHLLLRVNVAQGDLVSIPFSISSDEGGLFELSINGLDGVELEENSFALVPGGEETINVNFDSRFLGPDVYSGNVEIVSDSEISYLPIIFEVESDTVLFDADLEIPLRYLEVAPGDTLLADIEIFDLSEFELDGSLGESEIDLEFVVLDSTGDIFFSETETLVIEGKTRVTKTLDLPERIGEGDYFITVAVKYGSSVGTSSGSFSVRENANRAEYEGVDYMFVIVILLLLVIVGILIYVYYLQGKIPGGKSKKSKKSKGNVRELTGKDIKRILGSKA